MCITALFHISPLGRKRLARLLVRDVRVKGENTNEVEQIFCDHSMASLRLIVRDHITLGGHLRFYKLGEPPGKYLHGKSTRKIYMLKEVMFDSVGSTLHFESLSKSVPQYDVMVTFYC